MSRSFWRLMVTAIAALAMTGAVNSSVSALDVVAPHPAHLHEGTCEELDPNPAYPLTEVASVAPNALLGTVETSQTTIDVTLDDLLASPHALNVHESAENAANYIACGDVAGPVVDGTLVIGLSQQNDSGYAGVAVLTANDAGGTDVSVYLAPGLVGGAGAATPAAAVEVEVPIVDFAFDPAVLEVPIGTTVTWTNNDSAPHTATSTDGVWDSNILNEGDSFSFTFVETGTYDYICSIHPNMTAQIVVTEP